MAGLIGGVHSKLNADTLDGYHFDKILKNIDKGQGSWDDIYEGPLFMKYGIDVEGTSPAKILYGANQYFVINFIVGKCYGAQLVFSWGANAIAWRSLNGNNLSPEWNEWKQI